MPSEQHIIIKPIHTIFISVGFVIMIVSVTVYLTSLRKDLNNVQSKVSDQTIAIQNLTKAINCHIMYGDKKDCTATNNLSMK